MRMLFANIGWMVHYEGMTSHDNILGGGTHPDKHEIYNFKNIKGKMYGYVQPGRGYSINISRIEKTDNCEYIDDVLVVWLASNPGVKGTYIVGWYKSATVYSECQDSRYSQRHNYSYNIMAKAENVFLLPVDERTFLIPRANNNGKGFLGQSNIWYADSNNPEILKFRKKVFNYINTYGRKEKKHIQKHKIAINVDAKSAVEKVAVECVTEHYQSLGYSVKSVEKENKGWDLNATKNNFSLKVEVKGLAGEKLSVHITRNEFEKMNKHKSSYRFCVVLNALKSQPDLLVFLWDKNKWVCEDDSDIVLEIEQIESYIAEVKE